MKVILITTPANLVTNSLFFRFCPKARIKISTGSWFGDEKYFRFGNMNFKCWVAPKFCHIRVPVLLHPLSGDHIFMISNLFLTIDQLMFHIEF